MECTACHNAKLKPSYLEGLIPCHTCPACGGNLLMLTDYLRWLEQNENPDFVQDSGQEVQAEDTEMALLCPKTGSIMTKYRISTDSDHRLDYSPRINAVWMDAGEWELIKQKGLAGQLNIVFTDHWQRDLISRESAEILQAMYERKFGDHYEAIKAFREKLDSMPERHEVIAYLMADDPYRA
jgi:Zn-finger nucleic acid-binding protein